MTIARDKLGALTATSTTVTSATVTWASSPAAGSTVLVAIGYGSGTNAVSTVKDNGSSQSTFTLDANFNDATAGATISIYRADGISLPVSGSYAVTFTLSVAHEVSAAGYSYAGVKSGAPAQSNHASGTSSSPATGSVTPNAAGALYFGMFIDDSSSSETITVSATGFTEQATESNGVSFTCFGLADKIDSGGPTATQCTWTTSDAPDWLGLIAVYDAATGTGSASLTGAGTLAAPAVQGAGVSLAGAGSLTTAAPATGTATLTGAGHVTAAAGNSTSAALGVLGPYFYPQITSSDGQNTVINNNVWNSGAVSSWSQTLTAVSPGNWSVVASIPAGSGGAVVSYPDVQQLYYGQPLANFSALTSTFTETMNSTSGSMAEAAFDCWFGQLGAPGNEIMVWCDNHGQSLAGDPLLETVTLGGRSYNVYKGGGSTEYIYSANSNFASGTVDLLAVFNHAYANGYITSGNGLAAIEFGWEISSTNGLSQTFTCSQFEITETYSAGASPGDFTATGPMIDGNAATVTVQPVTTGDLILLEVINYSSAASYATALSSSNVTWTLLGHQLGSTNAYTASLFEGTVTSTASATVTPAWSGTAPAKALFGGQEFACTAGSWVLDTLGHIDEASGGTWASLTPAAAGELYFGYAYNSSNAAAGTASGYVWKSDEYGNGMAFSAGVTSAAQAPSWTDTGQLFGIMALLKPGTGQAGTATLTGAGTLTAGGATGGAALAGAGTLTAAPSLPLLVQETDGSSTGTTLTLTFPSPTTAGNGIVVAVCGYYGGAISDIKIGAAGGTFSKFATSGGYNCEVWVNYSASQTSNQIVITTSAAGIIAWAYEVSGRIAPVNWAGNYSASGTSWASGTTTETMPWNQFVVGMGLLVGSNTITPTGTGWTQEAAYQNVAGAAAICGASGYNTVNGTATSGYAGTAASSSGWGAVTATFLAPAAEGSFDYQPAWGGYVFNEHPSYTGISATFTVPASMPAVSTSTALVSVWVGLGNVNQVGVYLGYDASYPNGVYTSPWSWWIPGAGEIWDYTTYPAHNGDSLTLSMRLDGEYWHMTMANNTRSWSYTDSMSVLATNLNSWNISGGTASTPAWIYPLTTAEVIIEKEASKVADYGSITFTNITTTPAASDIPYPVFTVGSYVDQYPGPYSAGGSSFTMNYYYSD